MDGQRQYPADPDRWYAEHPDEDSGRVPGQRAPERYPDQQQWGDHGRPEPTAYGEPPAYGDPTNYGEPTTYGDPAVYGEPEYRRDDSEFATNEPSRRRRPTRGVRVGKRSGLEIPEAYEEPEEPPRYRTEAIDRQALRRDPQPSFDQSSFDQPSFDQPAFDQPGFTQPAFEQPSFDQTGPSALDQPRSRDLVGFDQPRGRDQAVLEAPGRESAGTVYPQPQPAYAPAPPARAPQPVAAGAIQALTQAISPPGAAATVYTSRRPALAALIGAVAVVAELLLLPVLFGGEFAHGTNPAGVVSGLFGLVGIPMVGIGLYALATGAAAAGGPEPMRPWLRTPLAYLPIGLILLIAAGLAA